MSKSLIDRLEDAKNRVFKLAEGNYVLKQQKEKLESELKDLRQKLQQEQQVTEELRNKIKIIKLAQNIGSSSPKHEEAAELKRKMNEYIREIDNCINMLNG